ncbi:hypothetical protein QAD02_020831 [Eretmocerus hayati]|uniref:Uncharacterized protein n=1 Tax=Eretmocerus hayati TaxID=131215 RepID=A0ACC2PPI9_9HYME|nr:hypothetical protein QAD02_020831 [Eretmocerus hayati]
MSNPHITEKFQEQNDKLAALLVDISNLDQRKQPSQNHPTPKPQKDVETDHNDPFSWEEKYNDAVTIRKDYHKKNAALKEEVDQLLKSVAKSKEQYKRVNIS